MKSQHIQCKTNTDLQVWLYDHQKSHSLTLLLCFHTYSNFFQIIIPVVGNGHACRHTYKCQFSQDVMVFVGLVHGNNYHSETNFHPQISGYNIVTKAIIVTFHISQVTYFTLARHGCKECQ